MKLSKQAMSKILEDLQEAFSAETPVVDKWGELLFEIYEGELFVINREKEEKKDQ